MSRRAAIGMLLAVCAAIPAARSAPVLYTNGDGWAAVGGGTAADPPPAADWSFQDGAWIGRLPAGAASVDWGGTALPVAGAAAPPAPAMALPLARNGFGACVVRSLCVRFDSVVRSRRWSLIFADSPEFEPLFMLEHQSAKLVMELEDVATGQRWPLEPKRRGREGARFPARSDPRFYGGTLDGDDIDWSVVVVPQEDGRRAVQGQIMLMKSDTRCFRLRIGVRLGAPAAAVLQTDRPPAVVGVQDGQAVGLFPDLAEPRRYRAISKPWQGPAIEMDLAVTKETGNFPRRATFSFEAQCWKSASLEAAQEEAVARLTRAGGAVALPETVAREGLGAVPAREIAAMRLQQPGGFRDAADALQFLQLKAAGLFRDADWAASAFLCAAQDAQGGPQVTRSGDTAVVAVNPDPDLEAMLEVGQNRGQTLLSRVRQDHAPAVWIRAGTQPGVVDHGARALYLCDYPAVWADGTTRPGVELGQAEAELISSLSCVLKAAGTCLLVEDASVLAPFTTYYADALVCASTEPAEMRRQHALAGPRPVVWTASNPGADAAALARDLGFVRPGPINDN